MKNIDSYSHVRGESVYVDDVPVLEGTLHAALVGSPIAAGRLKRIDSLKAMNMPGVVRILTAADVTGENQIGGIIPDEPLFAEGHVHFIGQPTAMVLAESETQARAAAQAVRLQIEEEEAVIDPREAAAKELLCVPPRTFAIGDTDSSWSQCTHIFEGVAESGGQEHLYIETQGAYAFMLENNNLRIISSTQGPTAVQRTAARVLGLPMHQIEVDVTRLGGGFGGKEDQATPWAVMAALGTFLTRRPVKLILHRMDDMLMTGKRHPYSSDFKIGLDAEGKILAYEVTLYQDAGAAADLSPAVMERSLFHANNSYNIPNLKATAYSCKTNVPPNTAFRGFGGPQGMFVIESAIHFAAKKLGRPVEELQAANLLGEGDAFHYGQKATACRARDCWSQLQEWSDFEALKREVKAYNSKHFHRKKGLALMPICFGISFTKTHMNQAGALVHIYTDGSIGVSTGAVEMGQGVNTKMKQVAAQVLGADPDRVKIEPTNTTRIANTSPSAASSTADLNGKAVEMACEALKARMLVKAAELLECDDPGVLQVVDGKVLMNGRPTTILWDRLVQECFLSRVALSEHAHYATPGIHFDAATEKGEPFAYHVYGTALIEVTVDCLRGNYTVDRVRVVHDFGNSMNHDIDLGQAEGGIVQGIGWMTMEDLIYDEKGRLRSNALSTYKVPDIYSVPKDLEVRFLKAEGHPSAVFKSKAVGEPPLMYGIGAYFAVRDAVLSFNKDQFFPLKAPITPERVLMGLYPEPETSGSTKNADRETVVEKS